MGNIRCEILRQEQFGRHTEYRKWRVFNVMDPEVLMKQMRELHPSDNFKFKVNGIEICAQRKSNKQKPKLPTPILMPALIESTVPPLKKTKASPEWEAEKKKILARDGGSGETGYSMPSSGRTFARSDSRNSCDGH